MSPAVDSRLAGAARCSGIARRRGIGVTSGVAAIRPLIVVRAQAAPLVLVEAVAGRRGSRRRQRRGGGEEQRGNRDGKSWKLSFLFAASVEAYAARL